MACECRDYKVTDILYLYREVIPFWGTSFFVSIEFCVFLIKKAHPKVSLKLCISL